MNYKRKSRRRFFLCLWDRGLHRYLKNFGGGGFEHPPSVRHWEAASFSVSTVSYSRRHIHQERSETANLTSVGCSKNLGRLYWLTATLRVTITVPSALMFALEWWWGEGLLACNAVQSGTVGRGEFRPRQTRQLLRAVDLKGRLLSCQIY